MSEIKVEYVNDKVTEKVRVNNAWWNEPESNLYLSVVPIVNKIEEDQSYRKNEFLKYARLYSNKELLGFTANLYSRSSLESITAKNRLTLNVVKACVDTAASKIGKMKPRPLFLTSDGDWDAQQRGKLLTKYIEGVFDDCKAYEVAQKVFLDAAVFGTGFLKIYTAGDKIKLERVIPAEIRVDDSEAIYGRPRQMHQIKYVSRELLAGMYPDKVLQINKAKGGIEGDSTSSPDMVKVTESWHLPSSPKSKDGKHCISIETATLYSEEYKKDFFPFVKFSWSEKLLGFFGMGLAEELVGIQVEINKLLITVQKAQHLASVPRIFVEAGSKVVSAHLNNEVGSIVKYVGQAPVIATANAMPGEIYQHLENLYRKAFEITGISLLSATSHKPSGLNSGVALREYQDIETERFMLTAMRYESMFLDLAKMIINYSRDLYEQNPDLQMKVKGSKFIKTIKWSDADLEDDKFMMKAYPTSLLPQSPQGKLDKVQELIQAGFISREDGLAMLDYPDLDSVMSLELASRNDVMSVLSKMTQSGNYIPPEPYQDLNLSLKLAQSYYLKQKVQNTPEEKLQLIRDYIEDCSTLIQAQQPQPEPQLEAQPELARPEQLPTSELMPQVPPVG